MNIENLDLSVLALREAYRSAVLTPDEIVSEVLRRCDACDDPAIWIHRLSAEELQPYLARLQAKEPAELPLYGVPFAIKDNIDLAGVPTTAACPEFAYVPESSAFVVERLIEAGAIPIGKTNLDQFATGLVGTRSPFGVPRNPFDPDYIPGGSSSGSAVAVARGLVGFALGTDTAGSGRVPAAFNNLVGIKPTRGLLSTAGVVPACRTLDCVSVFALDFPDAEAVMAVAVRYDVADPFAQPGRSGPGARETFTFGVPQNEQLEFFGDGEYERLFQEAVAQLEVLGGRAVTVDFGPFAETARLLYEGPWVAERYAAIREFIERRPEALHPVTRGIIEPGRKAGAVEAFEAQYRLQALRRELEPILAGVDFVVTPTAPTCYRVDEVAREPVVLNSRLGVYTNFMNLLDLAAVAVPAGFRGDGVAFGVTLFGDAFSDEALAGYGDRLQRAFGLARGATGLAWREAPPLGGVSQDSGMLRLVVCGAHMEGLPLSPQLLERGGRLVRRTRTAPRYRLFVLPGGPPVRPGLVRDEAGGAGIEVEVWELPREAVGGFLEGIPAPLGIGTVELEDGGWEKGFICERYGVVGVEEITGLGGWRGWLASRKS
jgi:allophanate hydrolase